MMQDSVTSQERRALYQREGLWDGSTLWSRVKQHVERQPDRTVVIHRGGSRRRSYAELARDAARIAAHLAANAGVRPGDVVSVQLPNWYEAAVVALAAQMQGLVINPTLPNYRRKELEYIFRIAQPKAIVTPAVWKDFDHRDLVEQTRRETGQPIWNLVVGDDAGAGGATWAEALEAADPNPSLPSVTRSADGQKTAQSSTEVAVNGKSNLLTLGRQ